MRKSIMIAACCAAALTLNACSEKTQDNAAQTADSAGEDIEAAGVAAGEAAEEGAKAVGNAADDAAAKTDELDDKAEDARARVEADAHNETVGEAKAD